MLRTTRKNVFQNLTSKLNEKGKIFDGNLTKKCVQYFPIYQNNVLIKEKQTHPYINRIVSREGFYKTCHSLDYFRVSRYAPKSSLLIYDSFTKNSNFNTKHKRFYHNDLKMPNFDEYRRNSTLNPNEKTSITSESKKLAATVASAVLAFPAIYVAKNTLRAVGSTFCLPGDILALSNSEINIGDIAEGKCITVSWRNQPVFVHHRTASEIEQAANTDLSVLRDPEPDTARTVKPEWLVTLAVCTHLGCVPLSGKGDFNGYFCPCHGSHYDTSGRIRKGPAPLNLEVVEHRFVDDVTLDIGPPQNDS